MKKINKRRLLMSAASIAVVAAPIIAVVSCGSEKNNGDMNDFDRGEQTVNFKPEGDGLQTFQYVNDVVQNPKTDWKDAVYVPQTPNDNNAQSFLHKGSGWYDAGFSWYELLNRPWYTAPGQADSSTVIQKILQSQKMFNIGFITAFDAKAAAAKAAAEPTNWYVKLAQYEAEAHKGSAIPTISGTLSPSIHCLIFFTVCRVLSKLFSTLRCLSSFQ